MARHDAYFPISNSNKLKELADYDTVFRLRAPTGLLSLGELSLMVMA